MPLDPRADKNLANVKRTDKSGRLAADCLRVQAKLTAYLDGDLNRLQRQAVQGHLETCAICRQEVALFEQSEQMLRGAREIVPLPGDLRADFYARLAATPSRRPAGSLSGINWRLAVPAFAVCGLLAVVVGVPMRRSLETSAVDNRPAELAAQEKTVQPVDSPARRRVGEKSLFALSRVPAQAGNLSVYPATAAKSRNTAPSIRIAKADIWGFKSNNRLIRPRSSYLFFAKRPAGERAYAIPATPLPPVASLRPLPRKSEAIQVVMLSRDERERVRSLGLQLHDSASDAPHAFGFDGWRDTAMGKRAFGRDAVVLGRAKQQREERSELSEQALNKKDYYYETESVAGKRKADLDGLRYRAESLADSDALMGASRRAGMGFGDAAAEADGVDFRVRDSRRGFVSGTRLASEVQQRDGRQVLSIRVEDDDTSMPEPGSATDKKIEP